MQPSSPPSVALSMIPSIAPSPTPRSACRRRNPHSRGAPSRLQTVRFEIAQIPIGVYRLGVSASGFADLTQPLTITSSTNPVLHIPLAVASSNESVVVHAPDGASAATGSMTPDTLITRSDIEQTPGASRTTGHGDDHRLRPRLLHDPRHAPHARRPPDQLAHRRRRHSQHQDRLQRRPANRPKGHRLARNPARQLLRRRGRPHLWRLQCPAPQRI